MLFSLFVAAQYLAMAGSPQSPGLSRPQHDNLEFICFYCLDIYSVAFCRRKDWDDNLEFIC